MDNEIADVHSSSDSGDVQKEDDVKKNFGERGDDYGLRRRLPVPSDTDFSKERTSISGGTEIAVGSSRPKDKPEGRKHHGAVSRIVLQDKITERGQPLKMKKPREKIFIPMRRSSSLEVMEKPEPPPRKIATSILVTKGWTTADTIRDAGGAYIIFAMRDFILYLIFLVLVGLITYGPNEYAYNYYATVISDSITKTNFTAPLAGGLYTWIPTNFARIRSVDEIVYFVNMVINPALDNEKLFRENYLVGAPVMRQIRVKNNTCLTAPMFEDLYHTCFDSYSEENEDKEPFGEGNSPMWEYHPKHHDALTSGRFAYYGGGGYQVNLTRDSAFNNGYLDAVLTQQWIRIGIRAVIIDFTLYTPNTNLFLVIKLIFEVPPSGGVTTKSVFTTSKFIRYLTPWDTFIMSCEILFILFTIYYTFEELQQMWILREDYLSNWWNILDITIICLSYCTIIFGIMHLYLTRTQLPAKLESIATSSFISFDELLEAQNRFVLTNSILAFTAWLKVFKFTSLYKSVTLIISAIGQINSELLMVLFMSFIVITGFSLCGLCLFGPHVDHFHTFSNAFFSLISILVGGFDYYGECKRAHPSLAPIYFAVYIILAVVLFFNLYVALIVYGYHCADVLMQHRHDNQFLSDLFWGFFIEMLVFLRQFELIKKLEKREIIAQNQEDFDAFVKVLKRQGWRGLELHLFLKTYGLERGADMRFDKMCDIYNDFCLRNMLFIEVEGHNEIFVQLEKVDKMFEFCDQAIVDIMTKMDYLSNSIFLNSTSRAPQP